MILDRGAQKGAQKFREKSYKREDGIEKPEEGGHHILADLDAPIITLAKIRFDEDGLHVNS